VTAVGIPMAAHTAKITDTSMLIGLPLPSFHEAYKKQVHNELAHASIWLSGNFSEFFFSDPPTCNRFSYPCDIPSVMVIMIFYLFIVFTVFHDCPLS
jgi:hypothetical protein